MESAVLRLPGFPLRPSRVHEVCGMAAVAFAAVCAAGRAGPLLWIADRSASLALNPLGLTDFLDPCRLLIASAPSQAEVLGVAEEALRSGTVGLVVAVTDRPIGLTPGRRLQLAAQAGGAGTTGLCLIPAGGGSNAAETRWQAEPVPVPVGGVGTPAPPPRWRWTLLKNKAGAEGTWLMDWRDGVPVPVPTPPPPGRLPDRVVAAERAG